MLLIYSSCKSQLREVNLTKCTILHEVEVELTHVEEVFDEVLRILLLFYKNSYFYILSE